MTTTVDQPDVHSLPIHVEQVDGQATEADRTALSATIDQGWEAVWVAMLWEDEESLEGLAMTQRSKSR